MSNELNYWIVENAYQFQDQEAPSGVILNAINGETPLSSLSQNGMTLANPATLQAAKIAAFFKEAKGITTQFEYMADKLANPTVYIFVTDPTQADYINRIIKHQYDFGGILLDVKVVQACAGDVVVLEQPTDTISLTPYQILKEVVKGNPNVIRCFEIYIALFNTTYNFCEASSKPCVYQADNISNARGFETVLPADLIKEIFDMSDMGCFISTYVPKSQQK